MKTLILLGSLALAVSSGCGGASTQQSAAAPDSESVAPPPPPPPAPPPDFNVAAQAPASPEGPPPSTSPAVPATGQSGPLPPLPSSAPQDVSASAQPGPAPTPPTYQEVPPAESQWVYSYPTGQWVFTSTYGWIWVPAGAAPESVEGVPYVYLYTPSHGWTWYVSPWGVGRYHYGVWVRHPWLPRGHAWVAHPRVVVRIGGGHRRRW